VQRLARTCLAVLTLAGCGAIDGGRIVPLEVWNRTLEPIFVSDDDGRQIDVPACGHAGPKLLRMDVVMVHGKADRNGLGFHASADGAPQYLVFAVAPAGLDLTTIRPIDLPPCEGHLDPPPNL
jgi:hypothetical protein